MLPDLVARGERRLRTSGYQNHGLDGRTNLLVKDTVMISTGPRWEPFDSPTVVSVPPSFPYAIYDGGSNGTEDLGSLHLRGYCLFAYMTTHSPLNALLFACVTLLVP